MKPTLSDQIQQHFFNIYNKEFENPPLSFKEYLQERLFFITLTFNLTRNGLENNPRGALTEFGKLHFRVAQTLLGKKLQKKRTKQPLAYAFIDFEGTRSGRSSDIPEGRMPHVHAVMLLRSKPSSDFSARLRGAALSMSSVHSIDVQGYDAKKGLVGSLASYCMKGYLQTPKSYANREDLWDIFPKWISGTKAQDGTPSELPKQAWHGYLASEAEADKKKKNATLISYPRHLRGFAQNRFGGHQTQRLRTYGGKVGAASRVRVLSSAECKAVETDLKKQGKI